MIISNTIPFILVGFYTTLLILSNKRNVHYLHDTNNVKPLLKGKMIQQININDLSTISMKNNNPIYCTNKSCIYDRNNIYTLEDNTSVHSAYNYKTWKNKTQYAIDIVNIINNTKYTNFDICMIGFCLGGMPLELSLNPNIKNIDCIDTDINTFRLFKSLIKNPPSKLNYFLGNGQYFFIEIDKTYDIIVDDAFTDKSEKVRFDYKPIINKINKNGMLIINIFMNDNYRHEIMILLKKKFKKIRIHQSNYNYLIICSYKI